MTPIARFYDNMGNGVDLLSNMVIPAGDDLTITLAAGTAPMRELTIPRVLQNFDTVLPDTVPRYWDAAYTDVIPDNGALLELGWRTDDGAEYVESMGRYYPMDGEYSRDVAPWTWGSSEVGLFRKRDFSRWFVLGTDPDWSRMTVLDFVRRALTLGWSSSTGTKQPTVVQVDAPTYTPTTADGWGVGYGSELWSQVMGVLQAAQLRLDVSDDDVWRLVRAVRRAGPIVAEFWDGPGGNILEPYRRSLTTVGLPQQYVVEHKWSDANGTEQTVRGAAGIVAGILSSTRAEYETRNEPATDEGAKQYAISRLRAVRSAAQPLTFTAPMMPWLRPDDTISVTHNGTSNAYIILSVSFSIRNGTMTLTTRSAT